MSLCVVRSCLEFAVVRIKTAEQRTIIQQYVIGTLAVNEWAVTFGTARRGLSGADQRPVYQLHIIRCGTTFAH